mmetsp:Transcript_116073/g.201520  ORF Transcript_116073/g.201520 Transcript_116073/m.201520 type:complete len:139 (+) Transcript_116073:2-418(+)
MAVAVLSPSCVDRESLAGPLHVCEEGLRSVFHAMFVTVGLSTGLLEMWLQRWLNKPGISSSVQSMRSPLRWLCTVALVCLPLVRRSGLGMNPTLAICEWVIFLCMLLHAWSARFEDEAPAKGQHSAGYITLMTSSEES